MHLSPRERYIAIVAVAALGLLVLDRYLLTPLMDSRDRLRTRAQTLTGELERAASLFERRNLMARKWRDMTAGKLTNDPARAESQVLHAVRDWSEETGFSLSSVKPDRVAEIEGLREITFRAAGTGPMRAVARFLWRIETADIPLRIQELHLGARTEGRDDLSLQLRLSTLYLPGSQRSDAVGAQAPPQGGREQ